MKILIVEDNKILSDNISKYLEIKWIKNKALFEWKNVLYELNNDNYDLIIMDLWLWDSDWIDICNKIRESWKNIPILILTARDTIKDKIAWFNSWADDYLIKPFLYEELLLRINSLIRRNFSIKWQIINENWLNIDINTKEVKFKNKIIHLSKLEFDLLLYLINNKWKSIDKKEILEKVWWEYDDFGSSRALDIYIWYLRKKIDKNLIQTIRWIWYMIK